MTEDLGAMPSDPGQPPIPNAEQAAQSPSPPSPPAGTDDAPSRAEARWESLVRRRRLPAPVRAYALRRLNRHLNRSSVAYFRHHDPADNAATRLPVTEHVVIPALWVTELYTPTTLSELLAGLRALESKRKNLREDERADDWVRRSRRSGGHASSNFGYVFPPGSNRFWPRSIVEPLPDGVDYALIDLSTLTATITAATVMFKFNDDRSSELDAILNQDRSSTSEPLPHGGYTILDVRSQKRDAIDAYRDRLRGDAIDWLTQRLPGVFTRLATGELPTIELLLTEEHHPWEDGEREEWLDLLGLGGWAGY